MVKWTPNNAGPVAAEIEKWKTTTGEADRTITVLKGDDGTISIHIEYRETDPLGWGHVRIADDATWKTALTAELAKLK